MAKLEESGKTVPGEVVDGEEIKGRKGARTYKVNVSFTPEGKSPVKKNFKVTKNFIAKVSGGSDKIMSDACQVKYDEADPDNAVIVDGSDIDTFMFPAGLVASVLGLLGTVWMLKR